ncbi:hypothetical protein HETIRDRAFT_46393 [Heterobasidion irregulare TC 32-1]|uniref:Geranylgeranyl pyrophosphate synthetase n=1 Tax=Heterobasidion irregulare (strain TC 32-1) TaxID=747525 RepID=W4K902_HETIT|nr:uncharacterized protein HETIRDRAFT_46393 [Heterobasidion irregulare TC 32-1]ETW82297.1 hypothetical protein HETIRDRAFT_46393 [Heterobasidion irregulare TC 32-1]
MAYSYPHSRSSRDPRQSSWHFRRDTTLDGLPPDRDIKDGLNKSNPVDTLSIHSAINQRSTTTSSTDLEHLEYIGSYNWTNASDAAEIIVPGSAPEWTDRSLPIKLSPDRGVRFSHQNGFKSPSSILLPLFKSVDVLNKEVDWPSVDFVTDRSGLRKIMRWVSAGDVWDFRIDMELAGKQTVLFNRWDARTREIMPGYTYGFNFEKAMTVAVPGCEKGTGHHRIVKYARAHDFCGLKLVVRFEVDACLPSATPKRSAFPVKQSSNPDDLADILAGINITPQDPATGSSSQLRILRAGVEQPQASIIELTTRSENRINQLVWTEIFPQLYLSQTLHFYVGIHSRGRFYEIRKQRLDSLEMVSQREQAETSFKKLGMALRMIQKLVIKHGQAARLSLVCERGKLMVYERVSTQSCLPAEVMRRFEK